MNYIKKAAAFISILALSFGSYSCQKCVTCNILDEDGAIIYPGTNVCGNKAYLDDYKATAEATAAQIEGATTDCVQD